MAQVAEPAQSTGPYALDPVQRVAEEASASPAEDPSPAMVVFSLSLRNGGAGWWKSPSPDLVRAPGR